MKEELDLSTDDRDMAEYAKRKGVRVNSLVSIVVALQDWEVLDQKGTQKLIAAIEIEDGRTFTPAEREALGVA